MRIFEIFKPNLGKMRAKKDAKGFIRLLNSNEKNVCGQAIVALGEIGDARAVEPLLSVTEKYFVNKIDVLEALAKIGGPAVEPLIKALDRTDVRWAAARALAKIGGPAVEPLIQVLNDLNDEKINDMGQKLSFADFLSKKRAAAQALGEIGDERAVEPLIKTLGSAEFSDYAVNALIKIGGPAVEPLIQFLKIKKSNVVAISILKKIRDARAVEPLIQVLKDEDLKKFLWTARKKKYLFCWDEIPGNDDSIFLKFIENLYSISLRTPKIEKINDDKTIRVFTEYQSILLELNNEKTEGKLSVVDHYYSNIPSYGFIGEIENGKLNIYYYNKSIRGHDWDLEFLLDIIECLGEIGGTRVVEPLIQVLRDYDVDLYCDYSGYPNPDRDHSKSIGQAVASALSHIGSPAVEPLLQIRYDGNKRISYYAQDALKSIEGN